MNIVEWIGLAALAGFALYGGLSDARFRTIPNLLCLAMATSGIVFALLAFDHLHAVYHLLHLAAALLIGMAFFALKWWGGGDAKFYAAGAAWFPISSFFALVLWISIFGILLLLATHRFRQKNADVPRTAASVPYGVAIAGGFLATRASEFL